MNYLQNNSQNNSSSQGDGFSQCDASKILVRAGFTLLSVIPILLLLGHSSTAQAQVSSSSFSNFGIETSSERFFEAGRENFEQEIRRLREQADSSEPLLDTSQTRQIQQDILRLEVPQLPAEEASPNPARSPHYHSVRAVEPDEGSHSP